MLVHDTPLGVRAVRTSVSDPKDLAPHCQGGAAEFLRIGNGGGKEGHGPPRPPIDYRKLTWKFSIDPIPPKTSGKTRPRLTSQGGQHRFCRHRLRDSYSFDMSVGKRGLLERAKLVTCGRLFKIYND